MELQTKDLGLQGLELESGRQDYLLEANAKCTVLCGFRLQSTFPLMNQDPLGLSFKTEYGPLIDCNGKGGITTQPVDYAGMQWRRVITF